MTMRRSLSAITLAMVLTSCVSNEVAVPDTVETPITFSVLQKGMASRASVSGNTYPTNVPFGTYAYFLEAGKTWANGKDGASLYINNEEVSYHPTAENGFAANSWHSSIVHYWPKQGSLTFYSYSPKSVNMECSPSTGLTLNGYQAGMTPGNAEKDGDGIDIMTAFAADQTTNTSSVGGYHAGVPTAFSHICSQVEVLAKLNAGEKDNTELKNYTINSITLNNLWTKANYASVGGWSGYSELSNPKFYPNDTEGLSLNLDGSSSTVFPSMIVIPQNLLADSGSPGREAPSITINYTPTETRAPASVEKSLADGYNNIWKPGMKYVITIIFSVNDAYLEFDTSMIGWEVSGEQGDIVIGN